MTRRHGISSLATTLAAAALFLSFPAPVSSQGISLTPYGGYRLGGSLEIQEGDLQLDDAEFYGLQLDYRVRRDATVALIVDYQSTFLRFKSRGEPSLGLFDLDVWYFQGGGTFDVATKGPAVPFVVGTFGLSWFNPGADARQADSEYGFAGIFGAGVKIPFRSGRSALRLQARVLLNNLYGSSSLWCGSGGGCYVGIGGPIGPVQFDFGGGITFGGGAPG